MYFQGKSKYHNFGVVSGPFITNLGKLAFLSKIVLVTCSLINIFAMVKWCSAQVQILLTACRRSAFVRKSDNGPCWEQGLTPFVSQRFWKKNYHHQFIRLYRVEIRTMFFSLQSFFYALL